MGNAASNTVSNAASKTVSNAASNTVSNGLRRVLPLFVIALVVVGCVPAFGAAWGGSGQHATGVWGGSRPGPGRVSSSPAPFATTDGDVYAMAKVGNVLYLGGNFSHVIGAGGVSIPASNIAAVNATTGAVVGPVPPFQASVNGAVHAIVPSPDGSVLYIGGSFTSVNGSSSAYNYAAAIDPTSGALISTWHPNPTNSVWAMVVTSNRVYLGGDFQRVGGVQNFHLAAVDRSAGSLIPGWSAGTDNVPYQNQAPAATDGRVQALALSPDGTHLYVGGYINRIWHQGANIDAVVRPGAASIFAADGSVDPSFQPPFVGGSGHSGNDVFQFVTDFPGRLIVAIGGLQNKLYSVNPTTGASQWMDVGSGDFQTIAADQSALYAGGHFHTLIQDALGYQTAVDAAKIDPRTGLVDNTWQPGFVYTPAQGSTYFGVWCLLSDGSQLYAGGAFLNVGGGYHPHLAMFPPA